MHPEFLDRLKQLRLERFSGSWSDGWIYGRLKQEFNLQPDELDAMASALGFKYGWNPTVKNLLKEQWQQDEVRWMQEKLVRIEQKVSLNRKKTDISQKIAELAQELEASGKRRKELTDIEQALMALIFRMDTTEQMWVLRIIFDRFKS
jgi:hypothetical protein